MCVRGVRGVRGWGDESDGEAFEDVVSFLCDGEWEVAIKGEGIEGFVGAYDLFFEELIFVSFFFDVPLAVEDVLVIEGCEFAIVCDEVGEVDGEFGRVWVGERGGDGGEVVDFAGACLFVAQEGVDFFVEDGGGERFDGLGLGFDPVKDFDHLRGGVGWCGWRCGGCGWWCLLGGGMEGDCEDDGGCEEGSFHVLGFCVEVCGVVVIVSYVFCVAGVRLVSGWRC